MFKSIERDSALRPFTREHHHILLFCYRMREGCRKGVSLGRIKSYADWFYKVYIVQHFESEEKHLFPLLGEDHPVIVKALADHRRLRRLFTEKKEVERSLHRLEEELDRHIRFEEKILFSELRKHSGHFEDLSRDHQHEADKEKPKWIDKFWLT